MDFRSYISLLDKEAKAYDPLLMVQESRNVVYLGKVGNQEIYAPESITILARRSQLKGGRIKIVKLFKNNELTVDGLLKWLYSRDVVRRGDKDLDEIDNEQKMKAEREKVEDHEMNKDMARFIFKAKGRTKTVNFTDQDN